MIQLINIRKEFNIKKGNNIVAVKDVSLYFEDKGMSFVLGKSGCGKSTLLNIIGGLDTATSGGIFVDGKSMKDFKEKDYDNYRNHYMGFVFQEYNLLENYSVYENISLALSLLGDKIDLEQKVALVLKLVNLEGYEHRKVQTLSGGEKQRVAIARAMVKTPKILIADEPTGALDEDTGAVIFEILKKISKDRLVIVVSHDRDFAEKYGDHIIEMKNGSIVAESPVKIIKKNESNYNFFTNKRTGLPFVKSVKLGLIGMKKTLGRLITAIFLCSVALALLCVSFSTMFFSKNNFLIQEFTSYENIMINNTDNSNNYVTAQDLQELQISYPTMKFNYVYRFLSLPLSVFGDTSIYYDDAQTQLAYEISEADLTRYNYSLVSGNLPQADNEIAISLYLYEAFQIYGLQYNNTEAEINNYSDIVGHTFGSVVISGVVDTKIPAKFDILQNYASSSDVPSDVYTLMQDLLDYKNNTLKNCLFINEGLHTTNTDVEINYILADLIQGNVSPFILDNQEKIETNNYRGIQISSDLPFTISIFSGAMASTKDWCLGLGLASLLIGFIMICNFVSVNIMNRKREIGILRAVGASQFDCFKIFAVEVFALAILSLIVSVIFAFCLMQFLNYTISGIVMFTASAIVFNWQSLLITIATCVITCFVALLVPLRRIAKLTPTEALRY